MATPLLAPDGSLIAAISTAIDPAAADRLDDLGEELKKAVATLAPRYGLTPSNGLQRPGLGRCTESRRLLDYEVEIGLVLGRALPLGSDVTEDNLADDVAGLVVTNDVSARDVQLPNTQFYESKSYPTFTPVGPALVRRLAALARPGWTRRWAC